MAEQDIASSFYLDACRFESGSALHICGLIVQLAGRRSLEPQIGVRIPVGSPFTLVAQWTERRFPKPSVAGSNPAERSSSIHRRAGCTPTAVNGATRVRVPPGEPFILASSSGQAARPITGKRWFDSTREDQFGA